MSRRLERVELWSAWGFATGATRLTLLPGLHDITDTWRVGGEGSCEAKILRGDASAAEGTEQRAYADAFAMVLPGRVVRFVFADFSWVERRIAEVTAGAADKGISSLRLLGLSSSLAKTPPITLAGTGGRDTFRFDGVGLTLAQHLDNYILPAATAIGLDFLATGVTIPTGKRDVPYDADDAWKALKKIGEAFECELEFRYDYEAEAVYLDFLPTDGRIRVDTTFERETDDTLTLVGGLPVAASTFGDQLVDPVGVRLEVGDNAAITRKLSEVEQRTRVYGAFAEGSTIAEAVWLVADITGSVIELADLGGGPGPVLVDDQLNGLYLEADDRITRTEVTDSDAGDQTITVADASAFAIGDRVRFRADSGGAPVLYLDDPAEVTTHGVLAGTLRRDDIPSTVNLVDNADQSVWTGASSDPADGWTGLGSPTLTRTTTAAHIETGIYSCRVQTTTDGAGYVSPLTPVKPSPYVSGFVSFKLNSGAVRVEMVATDGVDTWIFPDGSSQKAVTNTTGVFVRAGVAGIDLATLGITSVRMRLVQDGPTAADFYVDAAQVTESAGQLPLVIGAGPTQGWQAVNAELAIAAPTRARYEGTMLDFYRLNPTLYPDKALARGALHVVRDPSLGLVEGVRLLEVRERPESPGQTAIVLSSLPGDLRSLRGRIPLPRTNTAVSGARIIAASAAARVVYDVTATATDETITSADFNFVAGDVGATLWIFGAGADGAIHKTTLVSVTTEAEAEMADAAITSVTNALAILGTVDGVLTLAAGLGGTGANGRDGTDADARIIALLEAQLRELARRLKEIEDAAGGGGGEEGPPDLTGLESVLWTEARYPAITSGFDFFEELDFTFGYPRRQDGAWVADESGILAPVDGLYHVSAFVRWEHLSGDLPRVAEFFFYAEDNDVHNLLAYLFTDDADTTSTLGRIEGVIHLREGERVIFEVGLDTDGGDYTGTMQLTDIVFSRIGGLGTAALSPPLSIIQTTGTTTTTAIPLLWSLGATGADTQIRLNGVLEVDVTAGDTSETVTGLAASTEYIPTARHLLAGDESVWKRYDAVWTKPDAPTALSATAAGSTAIDLVVTAAHANASTRIKRDTTTIVTLQPGETAFQDTGLTPNTSYTYYADHSTPGGFSSGTASASDTTDP